VEDDYAASADTTVVVCNPGWGDVMQASKAGLMEVADVLVINKSDRPGADDTERDLRHVLGLGGTRDWHPPIVRTTATAGEGVAELWQAVADHRGTLVASGALSRRRHARLRAEVRSIAVARAGAAIDARFGSADFDAVMARVDARELDPYAAATLLAEAP
jgi:LAO/AO transport system kinase